MKGAGKPEKIKEKTKPKETNIMKETAKKALIKDIVIFAVTVVGMAAFWGSFMNMLMGDATMGIFLSIFFTGIPFGWRWASKVITAVSLYGIVLKAMIALFLGWLAAPVTIIVDIVRFVRADDSIIEVYESEVQ